MSLIGRRIAHFRIDNLIGTGGMGKVYRGFDETLKRDVAIKVLRRPGSKGLPEARARFIREARILSRLKHRAICQIYDLLEVHDTDFLVLELVEGETLTRERMAALDDDHKLRLAEELADVLVTAHRAGVVHRDLKPANLMLTDDGKLKVLDFGIARRIDSDDQVQDLPVEPGVSAPSGSVVSKPTANRENSGLPGHPVAAGALDRPADKDSSRDWPIPEDEDDTLVEGRLDSRSSSLDADRFSNPSTPDSRVSEEAERTLAAASLLQASPSPIDVRGTFVTRDDSLVGTLSYMSPEQALGQAVTPAADMFSFGILLREMLTGRRAYPEDDTPAQLHRKIVDGRLERLEGIDPLMAQLVAGLTDPSPSQRPSASDARRQLRRIRLAPERRRRRRRRQLSIIAATALVLSAAGIVLRTRFQQQQTAHNAVRFAFQARDVEWSMRTAALGPLRDTSDLRAEIRRRMEMLRSEIKTLSDAAKGPGLHALGCSAAALNDIAGANEHLEQAWQLGYRSPDLAADLGRNRLQLFDLRLTELEHQLAPEEREAPLAVLRTELRDPGLQLLDHPSQDEGDHQDLIHRENTALDDALVAWHHHRPEEALEMATQALRTYPDLYSAEMLRGRILQEQAAQLLAIGDYPQAAQALETARRAWLRAAEIGRNDPAAHVGLCDLAETHIRSSIHGTGGDIGPYLDYGIAACERALTIEPKNAQAAALLAVLFFRRAESSSGEPRLFEAAIDQCQQALELRPDAVWVWNTLGNTYMSKADFELFQGDDPSPSLTLALKAYQSALRLAPAAGKLWNGVGNVYSLRAELAYGNGLNPGRHVANGVEAFEQAMELAPEYPHTPYNLALTLMTGIRYQMASEDDPMPAMAQALEALDLCLKKNSQNASCLSTRGLLTALRAQQRLHTGDQPRQALDALNTGLRDLVLANTIHQRGFYFLINLAEAQWIRYRFAVALAEPDADQWSTSARRSLQQAAELIPDHVELIRLRTLLASESKTPG